MGQKQEPIHAETGRHYEAGESNAEALGGQYVPTIREETLVDQARNASIGSNDVVYVQGEMVREQLHRETAIEEVVPGPEIVRGATGTIPERTHSTQEDIVTHHAEDTAMHDAEVAQQNPPIVIES